jgi:hypothetical protein
LLAALAVGDDRERRRVRQLLIRMLGLPLEDDGLFSGIPAGRQLDRQIVATHQHAE